MPAYPRRSPPLATVLLAALCASAKADDGAASIAAGGIVMKHEPRITMQKETLRIGASKVQVDYEFRNDTGSDIITEVAFPVPGYKLDWDEISIKDQGFDDFQLKVEGQPVHFDVEIKATLKGREVSAQLKKYGIDISTFGHFNEETHYATDIRILSPSQRALLIEAGLLYPEDDRDEGNWTVEKKYYWLQTFPAHAIVHISHQYTPVLGNTNSVSYGLLQSKEAPDSAKDLASVCIDPSLRKTLLGYVADQNNSVPLAWVDFILTTANTWKTPIEDFTLIVERPHAKDARQNYVSFCWDGPVAKIDADHLSAHTQNLVPKKELRIGYITVYTAK
jgi:hypothetical protein